MPEERFLSRLEAFAAEYGLSEDAADALAALLGERDLPASAPPPQTWPVESIYISTGAAPASRPASAWEERAVEVPITVLDGVPTRPMTRSAKLREEPWTLATGERTDEAVEVTDRQGRIGGTVPRAPAPDALPFAARYMDLGPLGAGGMGEVRQVYDRALRRTVAAKAIRASLMYSPEIVSRFIEEAQVTAQLEHPGIVPVHEFDRMDGGRLFFTMKQVEGRTFSAVLREVHQASAAGQWRPAPSGWNFRRLIDAFQRVCEAVAYAHSRGVVHRDLKPQNIMVGAFGEVLVLDWGLVKLMDRPEASFATGGAARVDSQRSEEGTFSTRFGEVGGTLAYMPPEQALGQVDRLGPPSDVFALGAILYEILSGRPPIAAHSPEEVAASILGRALPPPGRVVPAAGAAPIPEGGPAPVGTLPVPGALWEICQRALSPRPEDRYPDAGALSAAMAEWLEGARRREQALAMVTSAQLSQPEVARLRALARRRQAEAEAALADLHPWSPVADKRGGWALQDEAAARAVEADLLEIKVVQLLRAALSTDPDTEEAHALLAEHYRAQQAAAEAEGDRAGALKAEALLRGHNLGEHSAWLKGDGALSLHTDPPGATALLYAFRDRDRRWEGTLLRDLGRTPLVDVPLPMGRYLVELRAPGRATVRYPVFIRRQERWRGVAPGEAEPWPVPLPRLEDLGPEDVYVPGGWALLGGDRQAREGLPQQRLWIDGFVIRRDPVRNDEYLAFLNDLARRGRLEEAMRHAPRERASRQGELGALLYAYEPARGFSLTVDAEGHAWQPDWPVMMVDWEAATAFAAWRAEQDGLPWRLPGELEWEKAARGVDDRRFPWGDFLDPTWCLIKDSHPGAMMLAPVDAWPADLSPYGVRGLAGNVRDWCRDPFRPEGPPVRDGRPVFEPDPAALRVSRGGAWYGTADEARVASRARSSSFRSAGVGLRLLRSWP